ncbi:uncharacterized protein RJT20DRAFT_124424 [Scheffersomyces xylosifermentans]|uniref:uncharacterized protein n=1 Tax=Scheffersomyces xylosifermentans TaxID=1304137 RepID=UPI00315C5333
MGKSLRSKSKLRAKSIKRKGEFSKFVDGRNKRIADRLEEETKKQIEAKKAASEEDQVEGKETMEVDNETKEPKKVSTSGWRDSRGQIYKQRKIKHKKGGNKTMKF